MKSSAGSARGFTMVELMIAMALSLVLLAAIVYIVVNSNRSYNTTDSLARLQENARFAVGYLTTDLRRAGFGGCMGNVTNVKSTLNGNPFGTTVGTVVKTLVNGLEGAENIGGSTDDWYPSLASLGITNATAGTDAIAARYVDDAPLNALASDTMLVENMKFEADTLVVGSSYGSTLSIGTIIAVGDCSSVDILQVTGKTTGTDAVTLAHTAGVCSPPTCPGNATPSLSKAYTTPSGSKVLQLGSFAYFVGLNANGRSALFRRDSGGVPQELVEGVENMQIVYGELTGANQTLPLVYRKASDVAIWDNVVSVRIGLLLTTIANTADGQYGTEQDSGTYDLNGTTVTVPAGQERRLRRVFTTTVALRNAGPNLTEAP